LRHRLLERVRGRSLERHVLRVDRVVLAVVDGHLDVLYREPAERSRGHTRLHALLAARLELGRDRTADDAPDELEAVSARQRLDAERDLCELPRSTGLLLVPVPGVARPADRLPVRDGRRACLDLDPVAFLEDLCGYLEVHVAHAPQDGL